jgi:hypothetical protein
MPNCSDHTRKTPLLFAGRIFTDLSVPFEFASNSYALWNGKDGSLFKQCAAEMERQRRFRHGFVLYHPPVLQIRDDFIPDPVSG